MASKWLPARSVAFRSKLNMDEVRRQFEQMMEPEQVMRFNFFGVGFKKPYEGYLSNNNFSMRRLIWYRNSFQPRITGVFEQEKFSVLIRLRMRLQIFAIVFLVVFLIFMLIFLISVIITAFMKPDFHPAMLIALAIFALVYVTMMLSFSHEVRRTTRDFEHFFSAQRLDTDMVTQ